MSIDPTATIHASADIEDGVTIGAGTAVWHRAQVRERARIGGGCIIGRDAFIDEDVVVGDRVKVQNAALIYHGVAIEDGVFIGPGAILTNDRNPRAVTPSGDLARAADWKVTATRIHTGASIGAGAVLVAGSDIGAHALVGAGAVVTRPVPAHAIAAGNPARIIGWACVCGQRLHGSDGERAPAERDRYAMDLAIGCRGCGRRYVTRPDGLELQS